MTRPTRLLARPTDRLPDPQPRLLFLTSDETASLTSDETATGCTAVLLLCVLAHSLVLRQDLTFGTPRPYTGARLL